MQGAQEGAEVREGAGREQAEGIQEQAKCTKCTVTCYANCLAYLTTNVNNSSDIAATLLDKTLNPLKN